MCGAGDQLDRANRANIGVRTLFLSRPGVRPGVSIWGIYTSESADDVFHLFTCSDFSVHCQCTVSRLHMRTSIAGIILVQIEHCGPGLRSYMQPVTPWQPGVAKDQINRPYKIYKM